MSRVAERARSEAPLRTDFQSLRGDFPVLREQVHGKPLTYLDNAASSQCPQVVIDTVREQQSHNHANVHRGVHYLSEQELLYPAGHNVIVYNTETKAQRFIHGTRHSPLHTRA